VVCKQWTMSARVLLSPHLSSSGKRGRGSMKRGPDIRLSDLFPLPRRVQPTSLPRSYLSHPLLFSLFPSLPSSLPSSLVCRLSLHCFFLVKHYFNQKHHYLSASSVPTHLPTLDSSTHKPEPEIKTLEMRLALSSLFALSLPSHSPSLFSPLKGWEFVRGGQGRWEEEGDVGCVYPWYEGGKQKTQEI
jgi:hypothetical protein